MSDFSLVLSGSASYHRINESDRYLAFLSNEPIKRGHTLVIPKMPTDDLFELSDDVLAGMILFSKKIVQAIKKSIPCEKVGVMVAGLMVRHAHIHLIPIHNVSDLNFNLASKSNDLDLSATARLIQNYLV